MEDQSDKKQVLVVEDDKILRELYGKALVDAGIEILLAENGKQGVELALKHKPSVILMDLEMPEMDGHQASEKIRLDDWGKTAHIIYLTNKSDPQNVAHAIMQKPEDYIVKANIPIKELVNRVRTAMYS